MDPVMALCGLVFVVLAVLGVITGKWNMAVICTVAAILALWRARHWGKRGYTTWR